ncbi:MAG: fluoride efflux transporter CrcB [Vicinamibacterales bacterium]
MIWVLVGVGGGLGAMARHGLNALVHQRALGAVFPFGIFAINVLGSALIGLMAGIVSGGRMHLSPDARTFLVVGVLGGFTTFSSFSLDTLTLFRSGHVGLAILNMAGQVGISLASVAIGFRIGLGG